MEGLASPLLRMGNRRRLTGTLRRKPGNNFVHRAVMPHNAGASGLHEQMRRRPSLYPVLHYKNMKGKDKHRCTKRSAWLLRN